MDLAKEDIRMVSVTKEKVRVSVRWRPVIRCGEQLRVEEEERLT